MIKSSRLVLLFVLPLISLHHLSCSGDKVPYQPASEPDSTGTDIQKEYGGQTHVYNCGNGRTFTLKVDTTEAWMFLQDTTVYLESVVSGSGAKFQSGEYLYWSKGKEARIETADAAYQNCMIDRKEAVWQDARLRGIDFRAAGNEPGWYMEIDHEDSTRFVLDYGEREFYTPAPAAVENPDAVQTEYRTETGSHIITIEIFNEPCTSMAGKRFPNSVELTVGGKSYHGCGKSLE